MFRKAAWRRLSTWLVGLFFIAQTCGVVHLLGEHTAHVTESQLALSHTPFAAGASHGHHHDGDADGAIQHHALQDLNGAPLRVAANHEPTFAPIAITAYVPDALPETNPVRLERPPKSVLSI